VTGYDGAGRKTFSAFKALGVEKWRTTTAYGGDRIHTTPPLGGTATTAITNVFNETVELRQCCRSDGGPARNEIRRAYRRLPGGCIRT
jgi:hypothetical protein